MKSSFLIVLWPLALAGADLSGTWELTLRGGGAVDSSRIEIALKDGRYSFRHDDIEFRGAPEGSRVRFDCIEGAKPCGVMTVDTTATTMTGSGDMEGIPLEWSARRPATPPSSGPARHEFAPTIYHRQFSSDKPPALRIFPGDTVHTTTVDSGGRDANGVRRVFGGNPLTGPFYIEGAMPGDAIAVKFTRIRLNRDSAQSGARVVPSALEPWVLRDQPKTENFDSTWTLDRAANLGRLAHPTPRLKNYTVPLRPMVGCVGVAPPGGEAYRSGNLGDWGGNLDYNQIAEGVTVFLPVYAPGALLFVGDGHAAQGDGELTGDALETSLELEFTVDLQRNARLNQARIESPGYIMFSGVGNSLPDALQHATTGLSRYLATRYSLNPAEVGIVLGSGIRYDIAEIVDPKVHIVAKLPRKLLEGLQ